ncbi:MAG: HNH endonuclease [Cetobacterium sp.]
MKNEYKIVGDIVEIYTKQGKTALIDLEDLERVQRLGTLQVIKNDYVQAPKPWEGNYKTYLHRYILDASRSLTIDHIDRNPLNNTKKNLRIVSRTENSRNRGLFSNSTSGFRGVSWCKRSQKWSVCIGVQGKRKQIGYSTDFLEACRMRVQAEVQYYNPCEVQRTPITLEST